MDAFSETGVFPLLLDNPTAGVDDIGGGAVLLFLSKVQRVSEPIGRFDGLDLPHYFRVFLGDLQTLCIVFEGVVMEVSADNGLLSPILALTLQVCLAI